MGRSHGEAAATLQAPRSSYTLIDPLQLIKLYDRTIARSPSPTGRYRAAAAVVAREARIVSAEAGRANR
jgi:hypothetical protein